VYFHARQYKGPDVVETFENTFAAWRFSGQPDRFKVFVGHRMQTAPPPFCATRWVNPRSFEADDSALNRRAVGAYSQDVRASAHFRGAEKSRIRLALVDILWPDGETEVIKGFNTEHDAVKWIAEHSEGWQGNNK